MGSSILQAILGGIAGGAGGITEAREQRRLEEEQRRQAEERQRQITRQSMLDIAAMADREGWTTPEARTETMRRAAPGLQEALRTASTMTGRGGAAARPMSEAGQRSLAQAAGQFREPLARVTFGGQEFVQTETPTQRAMREAASKLEGERRQAQMTTRAKAADEARKINALVAAGMPREQAMSQVVAGRTPDAAPLTPWQKAGFASEADYLRFKGREAAATRAPDRAPDATDPRMTRIESAVLQYARTPLATVTGERFPNAQEVQAYRNLMMQLMEMGGTPSATPPASAGTAGATEAFGRSVNPFDQTARAAAPSVGPTAASAPAAPPAARMEAAAPARTAAPMDTATSALGRSVNPFRGPLTPEEAAAMGVDYDDYQRDPQYRAFVDSSR